MGLKIVIIARTNPAMPATGMTPSWSWSAAMACHDQSAVRRQDGQQQERLAHRPLHGRHQAARCAVDLVETGEHILGKRGIARGHSHIS